MRNFKTFLVILTAILLTACGNGNSGSSEVTEASAASETTTVTTETTTAATAETTVTTSEAKETESVSETFTTAEADYAELYGITAEETVIDESIKNKNGLTICGFYANYPIFSGGDEAVIGKINGAVKDYIDGVYGEEKQYASENNDDAFMEGFLFMRGRIVTYDSQGGEYYTYRVNGNLLSVYFSENFFTRGRELDKSARRADL